MKTYNQFLNEIASFRSDKSILESYTFNIDMRNLLIEDEPRIKNGIINELKKHTSDNNIHEFTIIRWCYAWKIEIRNFSNRHLFIDLTPIIEYTPKLTFDLTPEEFLKVGLENVKDYLETKKNTLKYNL